MKSPGICTLMACCREHPSSSTMYPSGSRRENIRLALQDRGSSPVRIRGSTRYHSSGIPSSSARVSSAMSYPRTEISAALLCECGAHHARRHWVDRARWQALACALRRSRPSRGSGNRCEADDALHRILRFPVAMQDQMEPGGPPESRTAQNSHRAAARAPRGHRPHRRAASMHACC